MLSTYCEVEEDDDVSTKIILFEIELDFRTSAKTTKKRIKQKYIYVVFVSFCLYIVFAVLFIQFVIDFFAGGAALAICSYSHGSLYTKSQYFMFVIMFCLCTYFF